MLTERMVIGQAILTEMVHHLLPIKVDPGEVFIKKQCSREICMYMHALKSVN